MLNLKKVNQNKLVISMALVFTFSLCPNLVAKMMALMSKMKAEKKNNH